MAILEQTFSISITTYAGDNGTYPVPGFPVVAPNTIILVSAVYMASSNPTGAPNYSSNNKTGIGVNNSTFTQPIYLYLNIDGTFGNPPQTPIIDSSTQFVMMSGDSLVFQFQNTFTPATNPLNITVMYRVIKNQGIASSNQSKSIQYGRLAGFITTGFVGSANTVTPLAFPTIAGTSPIFYKSLVTIDYIGGQQRSIGASLNNNLLNYYVDNLIQTFPLIDAKEHLFQLSTDNLALVTGIQPNFNTAYYLSYYFDPLYVP